MKKIADGSASLRTAHQIQREAAESVDTLLYFCLSYIAINANATAMQ
jgi:hypothetical protein